MADKPYEEQATNIHKAIFKLYMSPDGVRVGFPARSTYRELVTKLKRGYFNVPFFGRKEWIRENIVEDVSMYEFLAARIEIEMVYEGKLLRWNGYGRSLTPFDGPSNMQEWGLLQPLPVYVSLNLGVDREEFKELLEGI